MIRHGETEDNKKGILSGPDTQLTQDGVREAESNEIIITKILEQKDCDIITSELPRTRHTAIMMVDRPPAHLRVDPGFNERDMGEAGGHLQYGTYWDMYHEAKDKGLEPTAQFQGMETVRNHAIKVITALDKHLRTCPQERVPMIFCHEGVIKRVVEVMGLKDRRFDNAGVYHFTPTGSKEWEISQVTAKGQELHEDTLYTGVLGTLNAPGVRQ